MTHCRAAVILPAMFIMPKPAPKFLSRCSRFGSSQLRPLIEIYGPEGNLVTSARSSTSTYGGGALILAEADATNRDIPGLRYR